MTKAKTVHLWLALDPETRRIMAQDREFGDGDFPGGLRGVGWPTREVDARQSAWDEVLNGGDPQQQDAFHRDLWDAARPEGAPLWPQLPEDLP